MTASLSGQSAPLPIRNEMTYDSRPDTYVHISAVRYLMNAVAIDAMTRGHLHDASKLESPEVEIFDEYTPKLKESQYGSEAYKSQLAGMKVGIDHHYAANSHHPEHHSEGVNGMTLMDLTEMMCDWLAATRRMASGDIRKSLEINQERFGYSDELKQIFLNTIEKLEAL